ncbi:manganese efflux pump [Anaerofustis stercorihominis]|uniref:manganese efflux pump n=1 Tax=Anaerofustis stercorihominis TaxID=214853 RepID=UPI00214A9286|nr:manganese efflux pump [Anaerofustis stercorihominis]MCR2033195.1 manganese efflux pump [Anaerofustis stercorihominis]
MFKLLLLIVALSMDTFLISSSFGSNNIRVKIPGAIIIALGSAVSLSVSILLSNILSNIIPIHLFNMLSFLVLIIIGSYNIFSTAIKNYLKKMQVLNKNISLNIEGYHLLVDVFIDETKADIDKSKDLDMKEALLIGGLGSMDSLCAGLSFPFTNVSIIFVLAFIICISLVFLGFKLGGKLNDIVKTNLSWFSGVLLIILAFTKIM